MTHFSIPSSKVVKTNARTALKYNIAEAIISVFLLLLTNLFGILLNSFILLLGEWTTLISAVFMIAYSIFVSFPVFLGVLRYFWRLTYGVRDCLSASFYYFSSGLQYKRAIKLCFILVGRILSVSFLCMLPFAIVSIISESEFYRLIGFEIPLWVTNLVLIRGFLYIIGLLCTLVYSARYYLTPIIAIMDDDLLILETVHISCMVAKGSLSSFISLLVSLAFWILASFLILPAIFTLPMVFAAYAVHARFAITNYNLAVASSDENVVGF